MVRSITYNYDGVLHLTRWESEETWGCVYKREHKFLWWRWIEWNGIWLRVFFGKKRCDKLKIGHIYTYPYAELGIDEKGDGFYCEQCFVNYLRPMLARRGKIW